MLKVSGRILTRERHPVADLVVAVFDATPEEFDPNDLGSALRLGSAATDTEGRFRVRLSSRLFRRAARDDRPDLTLGVFPPIIEGASEATEEPLFVVPSIRVDAGEREAFVIYLDADTLVERGVPVPGEGAGGAAATGGPIRFADRVARRGRQIADIRSALSPEVSRRVLASRGATAHMARLTGGRPASGAPSDRFLAADSDAAETLIAARAAGIARLSELRSNGLTLRLDAQTRQEYGIEEAASGGQVALAQADFEALAGRLFVGSHRVFDPIVRCEAEHRARRVGASGSAVDEPTPELAAKPTPLAEAPEPSTAGAEAATEDSVRAMILARVAETISSPPVGPRPGVSEVARALGRELEPGPADVPATHDFHHLQIAWDDVWTAAVDRGLVSEMGKLYEKVVEIIDWGTLHPDLSEIDELDRFMAALEESVEALAGVDSAGADTPLESELTAWLPEAAAKWPVLLESDRQRLWFLYWIDRYDWHVWTSRSHSTIDGHIYSWKPGPPFEENSPLWPLQKLLEFPKDWREVRLGELQPAWGRNRALSILAQYAPASAAGESEPAPVLAAQLGRARRLLAGVQKRLAERYRFDVFKPCSHNFGIITTFRQRWQPLPYQVGELVASIPLAPGEKRSYSKKQVVRTKRALKEVEKALWSRRLESQDTSRAESEILRKAGYSTNFQMTADGGFYVGLASANLGSKFATDQALESSQAKKDFREAVRKAAEEYRRERSLEVESETVTTDEFTEQGEIRNTNDELTVTYLFYELQRRFEVSERLHRVTPVVLVAFEVPRPDAIDEAWLLAHEWILRRVLLDDRFEAGLDAVADSLAGSEVMVEVLRTRWETQIRVVRELQEGASIGTDLREAARRELKRALSLVARGGGGLLDTVGDFLFGDSDASQAAAIEARRQSAQKALEWTEADLARAQEGLATAVDALRNATTEYAALLERRVNLRLAVDRLRLHVKQNILYYMQAVWLHEPPDQRYLRIYNKEIEWPVIKESSYVLQTVSEPSPLWDLGFPGDPTVKKYWVEVPPAVLGPQRRLHEVADLDQLLGFRGNYAIFPLKERNALTDFMMQSFLDDHFGVVDPDPLGRIPAPEEALAIAECAWERPTTTDEQRQAIMRWLVDVLMQQRRVSEELVVPTGQLFIEALPGSHPLLEDFKLQHRRADVGKAQADELQRVLEALRYAARIAAGELGDPEVETQIVGLDDTSVNVGGTGGGTS